MLSGRQRRSSRCKSEGFSAPIELRHSARPNGFAIQDDRHALARVAPAHQQIKAVLSRPGDAHVIIRRTQQGGQLLLRAEILQGKPGSIDGMAGAEPAAPGEFTRRALEHGRMSLTQAEAVMEVISANGRQA